MIWLIAIPSILVASLFWIWSGLRKAPEGYENETGFHMLRKRARSGGVVAAKKPDPLARSAASQKQINA